MGVRIFQPAKNAMQSGMGNVNHWVLEFEPKGEKSADPLMGWIGGGKTTNQLRMKFETLEEAEAYAKRKGLEYTVITPHVRKRRPKSYAANFAFDRVR
ncbi:MAG: ETC complex I subunit [Magnetospiraceae bacterium]